MLTTGQRRERIHAAAHERGLTDEEYEALLKYVWRFWARPQQIAPPGDWDVWLISSGRGYGKTRAGAEFVRERQEAGYGRILLVADDAKDARDIMIEGESGLLAVYPKATRPRYIPSQAKVEWSNGATAILYSANDPESLRGPQGDTAWCDELGKWTYQQVAWDNLMFGMRLGDDPRTVVTGTPTPTPVVRDLFRRAGEPGSGVVMTGGPTHDNLHNLAGPFARTIQQYEGTRLGRQELYAELLVDVEGALWTSLLIERTRVRPEDVPELDQVCVAVDPAVTAEAGSNETGIVGLGRHGDMATGHGYVLEDDSGVWLPEEWGRRAVDMYESLGADFVVAEVNQGGLLVEQNIRLAARARGIVVPVRQVHASRGKLTRAEPVATLYEQGRVHHAGVLPQLEDQMTSWVPGRVSPDRLDALVHGATQLLVTGKTRRLITA